MAMKRIYKIFILGCLALADGEMLLEVINIIIHLFQCIIGYGERRAGSILDYLNFIFIIERCSFFLKFC